MRGSLSLEFMLSLVLLLATATGFLLLAYTQVENTVVASTQYKAEAMAMTVGSAVSHFIATEPGYGSQLLMNFTGLLESEGAASFGMPGFSVYADHKDCNVTVSTLKSKVIVDVMIYRMDSGQAELVTAVYPFASPKVYCNIGVGDITVRCDKGINLTMGSSYLDLTEL